MAAYNDSSLFSKLNWDPSGLKTMSDSLKSILEQGILLEQALINHKNRILEKKANKANFNKEANESFMSESSKCSEDDRLIDRTVNNMVQNLPNYSINKMDKSETESHTSNSDSLCTNKALDGYVKLVDPTLLMDLNVNSAVSASHVTQFVTASSNALKNSLLFTDDNIIQNEPFTSCADRTMTSSDLAEGDLKESEGTNLSNVDKYSNSLTQDYQNILLPNCVKNQNSPNALLPFNLIPIKREDNIPVMPSPIIVKNEQKQENRNGLVEPCLQLNITSHSSDNIDIDNVRNTGNNDFTSEEAVISIAEDNMDLTKTDSLNSVFILCRTKLTEKIVSQFFKSRNIEVVQFKRFNSNRFSSGIVLLKNPHDVKRALKFNRKFLINGTPLCIKRYYGPKVQKEDKCMKGRKNKKQINAAKSKKNTNKKKPTTEPSKNNSSKKQLNTRNNSKSDTGKGKINNVHASQNMLHPETNTVSCTEFVEGSGSSQHMDQNFSSQMQNVNQIELHPNEECVDYRGPSNSDCSYTRGQGNRNINRQPANRQHQKPNNNQCSNNCDDISYKKCDREWSQEWSNNRFNNKQNQQRNQRRSTNQHYHNIRNTRSNNHSWHSGPN